MNISNYLNGISQLIQLEDRYRLPCLSVRITRCKHELTEDGKVHNDQSYGLLAKTCCSNVREAIKDGVDLTGCTTMGCVDLNIFQCLKAVASITYG